MNASPPYTKTSPWQRWAVALLLAPMTGCLTDGQDELEPALEQDEFRLDAPLEYGEPQTMLIRYRNGPGQRGSATLIAPNVLLTNGHTSFGGGPAPFMYVQRGTNTTPGIDALQVAEKVHHPDYDYTNPGTTVDIALLRIGCNITDIPPAPINRGELVDTDIGSSIKAVGYGPTGLGLADWGIKRSMGNAITSISDAWVNVSGVSAYAGDSGGSLYGFPSGALGPGGDDGVESNEPGGGGEEGGGGEPEGGGSAIFPQRKLIGVVTWSTGTALRVDQHSAWIDGVVADWVDPSLPEQPAVRNLSQANPPKVCPNYGVVGHYSIVSPEPGVTYNWEADGATVSSSGTSVTVSAASTAAFTLTVTAVGPGGCERVFEETFWPITTPCDPI